MLGEPAIEFGITASEKSKVVQLLFPLLEERVRVRTVVPLASHPSNLSYYSTTSAHSFCSGSATRHSRR